MVRGLLSGLWFGSGMSVLVVAGASLLAPLPEVSAPSAPPVTGTEDEPPGPEPVEDSAADAPVDVPEPTVIAQEAATSVADSAVTEVGDAEDVAPLPGDAERAAAPEAIEIATTPAAPEPSEPKPEPETEPETEPVADVAEPGLVEDAPVVETPAPDTSTRTQIGRPATSILTQSETAAVEVEPSAPPPVDPDTPAIERFAVPFDVPQDKPLMSIVLIDSGQDLSSGPAGMAALASFPYPLTFAIEATLEDAADRMVQYRAQGFEVMAMVDVPVGAQAQDIVVTMDAAYGAVPEAVGILEGPNSGLQANRETADQVTETLLPGGHGILWQPKGLDTAQKLAAREGIPSVTIFRDFDSEGQSSAVVRRFLDQAAFRARQENGVIMLGRLRPDTISALLLWGLQDRASTVAIAPVSAVLTSKQ